jgi:dUTP pyrophosphatase
VHLEVQALHPDAVTPHYIHADDSGLDLYLVGDSVTIKSGSYAILNTGIAINLPPHTEAQIRPKSGMAKRGLFTILGTIDEGYTGELAANVLNLSGKDYTFDSGEKIGQLVITSVYRPQIQLVETLSDKETTRGDQGFGSTGIYQQNTNARLLCGMSTDEALKLGNAVLGDL